MPGGKRDSRGFVRSRASVVALAAHAASCGARPQPIASPLPSAIVAPATRPTSALASPPEPPASPLPLDHLDAAWQADLSGEPANFGFARGNTFLLSGSKGLRGLEITTGRTRFQRGRSLDLRYALERWIATPTGYLVDLESGTMGPRLECPGDDSVRGCNLGHAVASESRIFAAARSTGPGPATCIVFARESQRLTQLWSRPLDVDCNLSLASNGRQLLVATAHQLVGLDSANGAELWRAQADFELQPSLAVDATRVLTIENRKLVVRAAATGAAVSTRTTRDWARDVILRDGVAYVIGNNSAGEGLVWAEDLEKRTALWQRQLASRYLAPIGADEDAVYLMGGTPFEVLALDRSRGQLVYSRVFRTGSFATLANGSSSTLLIVEKERVVALRRVAEPRAPETCRVEGRLRVESNGVTLPKTHPVRVADQIVWTDTQGRFKAEVQVHGDLLIAATLSNLKLSPLDCAGSEPVVLTPDGRTDPYGVELVVRARASCLER